MACFSENFEQSWSGEEDSFLSSSFGLLDLPSEVLVLILRYLPLSDLANARLVCTRLQRLVDAKSSTVLWANATLVGECDWVSNDNKRIVERAAESGNVEALIKLAVAYLYDEGVPTCDGKGSYESSNGIKATEFLIKAESLCPQISPFSWVLFRPPWSPEVISSKMCVFHHMRLACQDTEANQQGAPGVYYSIGKALSFYASQDEEEYILPTAVQGAGHPLDWYERGVAHGCPFSALELWKKNCKPRMRHEELECVRQLRSVLSLSGVPPFEAELELCRAYAAGFYGGVSGVQAMSYIRQIMEQAKPFLSERIFTLQDLSPDSRYILMDWLFEVACLKEYSPQVTHLIVNLVDSYLLQRHICKARLQLLAISAALLASRWSVKESLTIREASWLTDRTYDYDDVVRMVGELVAVHKGNLKKPTIVDYLDVLLTIIKADTVTRHMSYYLSESLLLYPKFSRFTASFLAAACLLEARVLLGHDYPWSSDLVQATGLTVADLKGCCLTIYQLCLTDKHRITDSREVQLKAIVTRYGSDTFSGVSQMNLMSYKELKEQLGWDQDLSITLFTPPVSSKKNSNAPRHKKRLSFLSDSQYLTSPPSDSEIDEAALYPDSGSSPRLYNSHSRNLSVSSTDSRLEPEQDDLTYLVSPSGCGVASLYSSSTCSSKSLTINPNGSGFPQPLFSCADDDEEGDEGEEETAEGEIDSGVSLSSLPPFSRPSSSNSSSSAYESTVLGNPPHLTVEGRSGFSNEIIPCSTSDSSLTSGASSAMLPTSLLDDDSRSMMDTLPPHPSNSQTNEQQQQQLELANFVSSLPLPTPSFASALERDAENTPFELDPTANHSHAMAVKQNLHLGSCDPKTDDTHYPHRHQHPRGALQPIGNFVREPSDDWFDRKGVRPLAQGNGRARSFIIKDGNDRQVRSRWNLDSN